MHVGVPSTNRPAVPWLCRGCAVTVPGLCCAGIRTMNWLPHTLPVSPSPLPPVSIVSIVSIVLDFVGRMRETARAGVGGWSAAWAGTGEPGKRGRQSHSANCIRHQSLSAWVTQLLTIPPHTPRYTPPPARRLPALQPVQHRPIQARGRLEQGQRGWGVAPSTAAPTAAAGHDGLGRAGTATSTSVWTLSTHFSRISHAFLISVPAPHNVLYVA